MFSEYDSWKYWPVFESAERIYCNVRGVPMSERWSRMSDHLVWTAGAEKVYLRSEGCREITTNAMFIIDP